METGDHELRQTSCVFVIVIRIELLENQSTLSGLMLDRIGVSTAAFDFFMLPKIHRKGFVASNILDMNRESPNQGGTVLQPQAGLHEHVLVFDFKSLYPTIMRPFKIDPLSRLLANEDPIKTPAGITFSSSNHENSNLVNTEAVVASNTIITTADVTKC